MREIKFRVWDGLEMLEFPDITEWDIEDYNDFTHSRTSTREVMQFTGLLDKNGREIYEGDYLQHDWEIAANIFSSPDSGTIRLRVEFKNGIFYAVDIDELPEKFEMPLIEYVPEVEIVGNVFQNPELLK